MGKLLLWFSGIMFAGYGAACFISPTLPAELAGLGILRGDGYAELGAMYGGLQVGVGLFCILCALRPAMYRSGLTLLLVGIGCLALARLYHAFGADWMVGGYTWGALVYELATATLAGVALRR